jgi:hypothetical protein
MCHAFFLFISTVGYATTNDATTNQCYNERRYNERRYNEPMLQWTILINKIRMLWWTQMLQRTRSNTISWRSTRVEMTWQGFLLRLEHQSSFLLSFVRFSYQFSSVICLFVQRIKVIQINCTLFVHLYFWFCIKLFLFKWLRWMATLL